METVSDEDVRSTIHLREELITRTRKLVDMTHTRVGVIGVVARELVNMEKNLRAYGLRCVENIVAWTMSHTDPDADEPEPFMWHGKEYLCTMLGDLNFVSKGLRENMKPHLHFEYE